MKLVFGVWEEILTSLDGSMGGFQLAEAQEDWDSLMPL